MGEVRLLSVLIMDSFRVGLWLGWLLSWFGLRDVVGCLSWRVGDG